MRRIPFRAIADRSPLMGAMIPATGISAFDLSVAIIAIVTNLDAVLSGDSPPRGSRETSRPPT